MSREAKYRLAFSAPGAVNPDAPSGGDFQTLAGALTAGWTNDASGGRSHAITFGGMPVMREDDLRRAFERLRALESERPTDNKIGCAAQVLREMGLE
jgi:hypothetical protein